MLNWLTTKDFIIKWPSSAERREFNCWSVGFFLLRQCNRKSNSILLCPSPFLTRSPSPEWKRRRSLSTDCTISFTMDNVESVRYVAVHFPDVKSTLTVHPDPVYNSFEDGLKLYKGEALILTVKSLKSFTSTLIIIYVLDFHRQKSPMLIKKIYHILVCIRYTHTLLHF